MGICHRNISLDELLVDDHRRLVMIDFGMCLRVPFDEDGVNTTSVTAGSLRSLILPQIPAEKPNYISPEVLKSERPFDGFAIDCGQLV